MDEKMKAYRELIDRYVKEGKKTRKSKKKIAKRWTV